MEIVYLADHLEFLPMVAHWHHQEWAYLRAGDTLEARMERLRNECGHSEIPTAVVAIDDCAVLGSAMLIEHDMDSRLDLSPWLASVFVAPERRRQGIGAALVRRIIEEARVLGERRLYLYTPEAEEFYAREGWRLIERTPYKGKDVTVMSYDLK